MAAPIDTGNSQAAEAVPAKERKVKACMAFLQGAMAGQPRPAAEMEAQARAAGFTHATIQAARERLHIASKRRGKAWVWIPPRPRHQKQPVTV